MAKHKIRSEIVAHQQSTLEERIRMGDTENEDIIKEIKEEMREHHQEI